MKNCNTFHLQHVHVDCPLFQITAASFELLPHLNQLLLLRRHSRLRAVSRATGTGQRAAYGQGLQNANMPKPTHGREKVRSQVEADAKTLKTTQPVASVMPVGS